MFSKLRRSNGRFVKRKVLAKEIKCVLAMSKANKYIKEVVEENITCKGLRIVDLSELGKNLKCCKCKKLLDLENTVAERRLGLHSVLTIICKECDIRSKVHTGKIHKFNGQKYSESNATAVLGCIHSGMGCTALKKLFACMDIPNISTDMYKRYELVVGQFLEETAKDSCIQAAEEERRLVLENIEKMCKQLPSDVVQDIYPHLNMLRSYDLVPSNSQQIYENSPNSTFDVALGNIVNIVVSYDMGWSKRGNGKSYDSLNGYATIIGFLSKKILDFSTRNRKCSKCDAGHSKDDHDCRLNFQGSAKAMEADAGVELIKKSEILIKSGLNVRAIIGDEDSSVIAAIRKESDVFIHKLADKNHLVKHFTSELYELGKKFKELNRKGVINHVKKCFTYAIAQNKGQSTQLANILRNIPDHLYGLHENCTEWCQRQKDSSKQTIKLTDEILYNELKAVFLKYANNAQKFSMAASSQGNESVNNIIAHKAPKNICLSKSAACDFRVASAVCTKNDGEHSIINIKRKLNILPGCHSMIYANGADRKRDYRARIESSKVKKLRRLQLKINREALRKNKEKMEGVQYLPNCGINQYIQSTSEKSEFIDVVLDKCKIVYFDLETSGLNEAADILQIAAISGENVFNVYINPSQEIAASSTKITGLHILGDKLHLHNKQLDTCTQEAALLAFHQFLTHLDTRCLLVAHNASFDRPRLLRLILKYGMTDQFHVIAGFADTLVVFKKILPDRKGPGMFKLATLYNDFIKNKIDGNNLSFHDAEFDVAVLQKLALHFKIEDKLFLNSKTLQKSLIDLYDNYKVNVGLQELQVFKNVVSRDILRKMAKAGFTSDSLIKLYKNEGKSKIIEIFSNKADGKPLVSRNKKVLEKIIKHLANF